MPACRYVFLALGLTIPLGSFAGAAEDVVFNRDIRPILSDICYQCHGPDAGQRQAGLRLDTSDGATGLLESGARAVVPGDLEASELLRRITSSDADVRMPPPDSGKQLSAGQIELLRRWIAQGAPWQGHWSFLPPQRPEIPAVQHADLVRNPIDNFILQRVEQAGLPPSAEADREALLRRVTLDLTGLPPTLAEVDAFLADTSPNAYEKVVDRLLQSQAYGEHFAREWLDLARYGDTHGLHLDNERALWKYREWVIRAFQENKPYDQFTVEQLAGDLLPSPSLDQQIATGFNRCNVTTSEGGSINEEVIVRYAIDRTSTMGTVFMGLTLGCAVCHDHKFDPISQKEFYELYAFFNSAADAAMDGNQLAPPPIVRVPTEEQTARLKELETQIAAKREEITQTLASIEYTDPEPDATLQELEPYEYVWIEDEAPAGAKLEGDSSWEFVAAPEHPVHAGEKATRRQAEGLSQHFFTGAKPGLQIGEGDKLFAYVYLDPQTPPKTVMLQFNDGSWEHRAFWGEDLIPFGAGGKENHLALGPLPELGKWVRLEVEAAAVGLKPGAVLNGWAFTQHAGIVYWDHAGSVTRTPQAGKSFESLAKWQAFERAVKESSTPAEIRDLIKLEADKRTEEQVAKVRAYFLEHVYEPARQKLQPLRDELAKFEQEQKNVDGAIPVSMVMAEMGTPRDTHILIRGQYDKLGDKVVSAVPAVFPGLPAGAPGNRLGLAQWLVQPAHPLTARVAVNRYWQHYFGRGLVKTAEDFGAQGEWPSHPELLDWLAVEFIESGWDVKRMQKLLVMSATYRQRSDVTAEVLQADPENVLLARGARFRLDAEVVRDSALFVGGLLVDEFGGKSVRPYQPPGVWEAVGFVGSNTREFKRDSGDALYRRSLYTFWKRTAPPPALMAFDAPSRETCVARRARTNTPLQALVLMNDEQYVEASRHLAARMMQEGGASREEQLTYGFRLVTARRPTPAEQGILQSLYEQHLAHYQAQPQDAEQLLSVGETKRRELDPIPHASLTMIANMLLNLDESITKE